MSLLKITFPAIQVKLSINQGAKWRQFEKLCCPIARLCESFTNVVLLEDF
jgi:hypothetical protein